MNSSNQKTPKIFTISIWAVLFALIIPFTAFTQNTDSEQPALEVTFRFTNEQLLNFFDANQQISAMQREMQQRMAEEVAKVNLTLERFNQIARANQIGALAGGAFTDAEINSFNVVGPQISQIQREQQSMVAKILESMGFNAVSYQEVLNEYRKDEQLQTHVRELLRERRRQEILEERKRAAEESARQG